MKILFLVSTAIALGIWLKPVTPNLFISTPTQVTTVALITPTPTPSDAEVVSQIVEVFKKKKFTKYMVVPDMQSAVKEAVSRAQKGDVVLLSPGALSHGIFKNEYDRGDQFVREVNKIK